MAAPFKKNRFCNAIASNYNSSYGNVKCSQAVPYVTSRYIEKDLCDERRTIVLLAHSSCLPHSCYR